ncbi:MAG: DUF2489 domain-containing protein [Hahellaceae bacterium]|nr:DUF2489 domain-containing protein [Hahellaceae bacterium]
MSQNTQLFLILVGLIICVGLIWFNLQQWKKIKHRKNAIKVAEDQQALTRKELIESLQVLALCILEDQVELSEGCIRIKVLLDHLAPELHENPQFAIFNEIYDALAHMPTHEARLATDKRFLFKMDQQRFKLEKMRKEEILAGAQVLRNYTFKP